MIFSLFCYASLYALFTSLVWVFGFVILYISSIAKSKLLCGLEEVDDSMSPMASRGEKAHSGGCLRV